MKKYLIILANVWIICGILLFIVRYSDNRKRETVAAQWEAFENLTLAMEQVTANYLQQEQRICDAWAGYVNMAGMSMEQAIAAIAPGESVSAHILRADGSVFRGLSTSPRTDSPDDYRVSYNELDIFKPLDEISPPGEEVNITRAYTNPMDGTQCIGFYDKIRLTDGDALVVLVAPTSSLEKKWVFPTEEYRDAEISLIDGNGYYIIKGKSFKNSSFFEFYKSYNSTDYARQSELEAEFISKAGALTMLNSKGQECLIAHSPVNSTEDWAIVSYILTENLRQSSIDWLMFTVSAALIFLLLFDLLAMLSFNRTLQKTALAAERANLSKSAFLSNMSHEIRTPITAILGMNEMIQRESENENVLKYSDTIQTAGASLLGIISDILDFSKIEAGRMELVASDYSLSGMVSDLINLTRLRAEGKGLSLETDVDARLPEHLCGDEIRMKQIIINLLSNAVKYTEKGGVRLSFRMEGAGDDFVMIGVSVADTGIGIRPEDMSRLFTEFERLDPKKTRGIEGSGLGLAIAHRMLSLMGSTLEAESAYGIGSRFFFRLRQAVTSWETVGEFSPTAPAPARKKSRSPFAAPDARILIVDDTPTNLQVLRGLLTRTEMRIDTAESGHACIAAFAENDYDLIFLDYRMPVMDGVETLEALREASPEKFSRTPIVCLTANAVSGNRERMLTAGFTDYLSKPVDIEEMEALLIRYLPPEKVRLADTFSEKVRLADAFPEENPLQNLPAALLKIPSIDPAKGIRYCGDAENYLNALRTFEKSIEARVREIESSLSRSDADAYTLAAHSLKSASRAIGADALSDLAFALEQSGSRADADALRRDTPRLVEVCRELKAQLQTLFDSETPASAPLLSDEVLQKTLSDMRGLCAVYDYDGLCNALESLERYAIPETRREFFETLRRAVHDCDWTLIRSTLEEIA